MKVAVLGAGIAGLAAGWTLQRLGQGVTVFDPSDRVGGKIHSLRVDGYLLELGPHSLQASHTALYEAVGDLGLKSTLLEAGPKAQNRFVYQRGNLEPIPLGPAALIRTPLLSGRAKWRLLKEPFIARRAEDESVADFFTRRLGPEVVTRLIDPFISGVYAGDPGQLSIAAALPRLKELERLGGSIVRGALISRRQARKEQTGKRVPRRRGMYAFRDGLQEIPDALAGALEGLLRLGAPVDDVVQSHDAWRINGERFDAVIATSPAHAWTALPGNLRPASPPVYTPVAVAHLSYPQTDVGSRTDGFGLLIPAVEQRRILGILFDSSLFPYRAPDGEHLFTVFLGGERNRWISRESRADLLRIACEEVGDIMQIKTATAPLFSHLHLWAAAIPQYGFGHGAFVRNLDRVERAHPTWAFAGNYRQGISVGQSFESGVDAARRLVHRLKEDVQHHQEVSHAE